MSEQWRTAFERLCSQLDAEALNTPALRVVMAQTTPEGNSPDELIRRAAAEIGANTMLSIYPPTQWRVTFRDDERGHGIGADTGEELTWTVAFCVDGDNSANPAAFWGLAAAAGVLLRQSPAEVFLGMRNPLELLLPRGASQFMDRRTEKGGWVEFWLSYVFQLAHADDDETPLSDISSGVDPYPEYYAALPAHPAAASVIAVGSLFYCETLGIEACTQSDGFMGTGFNCPSGPVSVRATTKREPAVAEPLSKDDTLEHGDNGQPETLKTKPSGEPVGARGHLSVSDLAKQYDVDRASLEQRLIRYRRDNPDACVVNENPKSKEPMFLYPHAAVMPIINALRQPRRS